MANGLFAITKNAILKADCDFDANLQIIFVDHADDTPVLATDDFHNDIAGAAIVATSGNLGSVTVGTVAAGTFDAADTTVSTVSGDQFESIVGFKATGNSATANLIWYQDTGTGLPFTPAGSDVVCVWSASGIISWSG